MHSSPNNVCMFIVYCRQPLVVACLPMDHMRIDLQ